MSEAERDKCLALAEWYSLCPRKSKKMLMADYGMWIHLFLWVGMYE